MGCKCEQTNDFMATIRKAFSEKKVVWANAAGDLFSGDLESAKNRLETGTIECYFVPEKTGYEITFKTVNSVEKIPEKKEKK